MSHKLIRDIRFDLLREGDTCFSRSDNIKSSVIAYATSWGNSREGRRRARAAVKNKKFPNHGFTVHDSWGQKYPIEAGPFGYARGDFDEYRTANCRIVKAYRWAGFDDPLKRELCAKVLEHWARKNIGYDWWGAVTSSKLGRFLFWWKKEDPYGLFCTEGGVYVLIICGLFGSVLAYNVDLALVKRLGEQHLDEMPLSNNPIDVMVWMSRRPDMVEIKDYYVE